MRLCFSFCLTHKQKSDAADLGRQQYRCSGMHRPEFRHVERCECFRWLVHILSCETMYCWVPVVGLDWRECVRRKSFVHCSFYFIIIHNRPEALRLQGWHTGSWVAEWVDKHWPASFLSSSSPGWKRSMTLGFHTGSIISVWNVALQIRTGWSFFWIMTTYLMMM